MLKISQYVGVASCRLPSGQPPACAVCRPFGLAFRLTFDSRLRSPSGSALRELDRRLAPAAASPAWPPRSTVGLRLRLTLRPAFELNLRLSSAASFSSAVRPRLLTRVFRSEPSRLAFVPAFSLRLPLALRLCLRCQPSACASGFSLWPCLGTRLPACTVRRISGTALQPNPELSFPIGLPASPSNQPPTLCVVIS
jgi:hypothetical protein